MPSEIVELRGHIIDSLLLPKVLDEIIAREASFKMEEVRIGARRVDQSYARIEVSAPTKKELDALVLRLRQHGAAVSEKNSVKFAAAPADGVFPQGFYVTTNQQTFVRLADGEIEVKPSLMDSGIVVDRQARTAVATKFDAVRKGMEVVVGHHGIRVAPVQRSTARPDVFEFISSNVSIEKPKSAVIREVAREFIRTREEKGKILVVAGPAVVHTGAVEHFEKLIQWGFVDLLFGGNGLAAHDIENALFGTSLGVNLEHGAFTDQGSQNHIRAINAIRGAGGIRQAVTNGLLKSGIMYTCVKNRVDFVLTGSIRDDGPLPEVITDVIEAQNAMRAKVNDITIAMMMGTMLHSMAAANILPATVRTICVDINPGVVAKLTGRETFQSLGLVTDLEPFLRELTYCLSAKR
jgi:lysine-ketoglutarate reductase/saccharopine dehydrogenase-like protein (TIGR00300 family)